MTRNRGGQDATLWALNRSAVTVTASVNALTWAVSRWLVMMLLKAFVHGHRMP